MRSRYTAFVQRQLDHVERSHAPEIRDDFNRAEAERFRLTFSASHANSRLLTGYYTWGWSKSLITPGFNFEFG